VVISFSVSVVISIVAALGKSSLFVSVVVAVLLLSFAPLFFLHIKLLGLLFWLRYVKK
jgi:hypothetical protein